MGIVWIELFRLELFSLIGSGLHWNCLDGVVYIRVVYAAFFYIGVVLVSNSYTTCCYSLIYYIWILNYFASILTYVSTDNIL